MEQPESKQLSTITADAGIDKKGGVTDGVPGLAKGSESSGMSKATPDDVALHLPSVPMAQMEGEIKLPLELIDPSPYQPRLNVNEDALMRLADSISADGLINPVIVRQKTDGRYELIGGERRWRAMALLHRSTIRAVVKNMGNSEAEVMALADNDAREDLTDYERAKSYKRLIDGRVVDSQSDLARRIGKERSYVAKCMAYFRLPVEVWPLLDQRNDLLGATNAKNFAAFMEQRNGADADLITDAIRKVFDRKLDAANALNWLKGQIKHRHNPALAPQLQEWRAGNRRIGNIRVDGRKVVISCAEGVTPDELINKLLSAEFAI